MPLLDEIKDAHTPKHETVLVMQGGGSLGAYECGVYKTLEKHGIKFDIVAGTSIGAINAGIIVGSRNPARDLEDFWLSAAEHATPSMLSDDLRAIAASTYSAMFGNSRIFNPVWSWMFASNPVYTSPHLYDLEPLKKTLPQYIDFDRLSPEQAPRLIVSATDIRTSESVVFDSHREKITADELAACAGFPFYGISWTKVDGRYLWDGSLLSNTPLREVINASPRNHKRVYIVSLFPKNQEQLPRNLADSWHRARDIMHNDKTDHNIHMSKLIKRYLRVMREMHDMLNNVKLDEKMTDRLLKVEQEYHKLATARGAIIEHVVKIERKEDTHYIFEDADFSIATIKKLIRQGEQEAEKALKA